MITKNAKYGLIKNKDGITRIGLYNHWPSLYPAHDELLEDVKIEIDNGIMSVNANMVCFYWNYSFDIMDEKTMTYEELKKDGGFILDPRYIETPRFHKFFPKLFPIKYTKRWIEEKERRPFQITANSFEIIEGENCD